MLHFRRILKCFVTNDGEAGTSPTSIGQSVVSATPPRQRATSYCAADVSKLQELGLEALRHLPYSPDLEPTDLFQNLDNYLAGIKFNTREAGRNAIKEFVASPPADFFKKAIINKLPLGWQRCIDCMGFFD